VVGFGRDGVYVKTSDQVRLLQVGVSVTIVVDDEGNRPRGWYTTDSQIRAAISGANQVLQASDASWRLVLTEVVEVRGATKFLVLRSLSEHHALEEEAMSDRRKFHWNDRAINVFVVRDIRIAGGICSFPADLAAPHTREIITINNTGGILNGAAGWLHEIGQALCRLRTQEGRDSRDCNGEGAIHESPRGRVRCSDVCPDDFNVMSYNRMSSTDARFTECQLREMRYELTDVNGTRSGVVQDGPVDGFSWLPSSDLVSFRRGDSTGDGEVNITDPIRTLSFLFGGGVRVDCADAADANDDGAIDLSDAVATLQFLFGSGILAAPGAEFCGPDSTADDLPDCVYDDSHCPVTGISGA